jgi:hypothetical protein
MFAASMKSIGQQASWQKDIPGEIWCFTGI